MLNRRVRMFGTKSRLRRNARLRRLATVRLALLGCMARPAGQTLADGDEDPTEAAVKVVDFIAPEQPLDKLAPSTAFFSPDGERIWNAARQRALNDSLDRPGGIFDFSKL